LPVQRLCKTAHSLWRALRFWNNLPQELRLFPRLCTETIL